MSALKKKNEMFTKMHSLDCLNNRLMLCSGICKNLSIEEFKEKKEKEMDKKMNKIQRHVPIRNSTVSGLQGEKGKKKSKEVTSEKSPKMLNIPQNKHK